MSRALTACIFLQKEVSKRFLLSFYISVLEKYPLWVYDKLKYLFWFVDCFVDPHVESTEQRLPDGVFPILEIGGIIDSIVVAILWGIESKMFP